MLSGRYISALQQHVLITDNSRVRKSYFLIKQNDELHIEEMSSFYRPTSIATRSSFTILWFTGTPRLCAIVSYRHVQVQQLSINIEVLNTTLKVLVLDLKVCGQGGQSPYLEWSCEIQQSETRLPRFGTSEKITQNILFKYQSNIIPYEYRNLTLKTTSF